VHREQRRFRDSAILSIERMSRSIVDDFRESSAASHLPRALCHALGGVKAKGAAMKPGLVFIVELAGGCGLVLAPASASDQPCPRATGPH